MGLDFMCGYQHNKAPFFIAWLSILATAGSSLVVFQMCYSRKSPGTETLDMDSSSSEEMEAPSDSEDRVEAVSSLGTGRNIEDSSWAYMIPRRVILALTVYVALCIFIILGNRIANSTFDESYRGSFAAMILIGEAIRETDLIVVLVS